MKNKEVPSYEITPSDADSTLQSNEYTGIINEPPVFTVRNNDGKICILSKFFINLFIRYHTETGEQSVMIYLPPSVKSNGKCGSPQENPVLELSWPGFHLNIHFIRIPSSNKNLPDKWTIEFITLLYDIAGALYDGAIDAGKKVVMSDKNITQFETSIEKSYYCQSSEVAMYNRKNVKMAMIRLMEVRLQSYGITNGKFSEAQNCNHIYVGGLSGSFAEGENVPIAEELTSGEGSAVSSNDFTIISNEPAPTSTFAVWDEEGKICILAKFLATFIIFYPSSKGEKNVSVGLPENARSNGKCGSQTEDPVLQLFWLGFRLKMTFTRISSKDASDRWIIRSIELSYNTAGHLFDRAINAKMNTVWSKNNATQFETQIGKSYYCPSPDPISLYNAKQHRVAIFKLKYVKIQPFGIKKGIFSEVQTCSFLQYRDSQQHPKHENITLSVLVDEDNSFIISVVNSLTVLIVFVILCYSLHRSMVRRVVDYDTKDC